MEAKVEIGGSKLVLTALTADDSLRVCMECASRPFWVDDTQRIRGVRSAYFGAKIEETGQWISCIYYDRAELCLRPAWRVTLIATGEKSRKKVVCSKLFSWSQQVLQKESELSAFWCRVHVDAVPFFEQNGWVCIAERYEMTEKFMSGHFQAMAKNFSR